MEVIDLANLDVANLYDAYGWILDLGGMAQCDVLAERKSAIQAPVIVAPAMPPAKAPEYKVPTLLTLRLINNRLYQGVTIRSATHMLETNQVLRFCSTKAKLDPRNTIYDELIVKVCKLKAKEISPLFIERFCLGKITDHLLSHYSFNVGEAFVIAYVMLNQVIDLDTLYFKINSSGLLSSATIGGDHLTDVEAISKLLIVSLLHEGFLHKAANVWLNLGKNFHPDL